MLLNNKGFSLIEVIATLVIGGILLAVAGMGIVKVTEALVFTQKNASTTLKAQVALTRIEKELHLVTGVDSSITTSIFLRYTSNKGGVPGSHSISFSDNKIRLGDNVDGTLNNTLIDNVASFSLAYRDTYNGTEYNTWSATRKVIKITFAVTGAGGVNSPFTMSVTPNAL